MSLRFALRLVPALVLLGLSAASVSAQTPPFVPAARFYGSATVFGAPAPASASVLAQGSSGAVCGSGWVAPYGGYYSLDIQPSSPCSGPISFYVNGAQADEISSAANAVSGAVALNLTVSSLCAYAYGACPASVPPTTVTIGYGPPGPPVTSAVSPNPVPVTVTYQPGWNLIAGAQGQIVSGTTGTLFTFQPGNSSYQSLPSSASLQSGYGYWAQFPAAGSATLLPGGSSIYRSIPPGQFALIGNPFNRPATVTGVSSVYAYDPVRGYQTVSVLQPGQGAWAVGTGAQIVIAST
jgi:hypothetical protein